MNWRNSSLLRHAGISGHGRSRRWMMILLGLCIAACVVGNRVWFWGGMQGKNRGKQKGHVWVLGQTGTRSDSSRMDFENVEVFWSHETCIWGNAFCSILPIPGSLGDAGLASLIISLGNFHPPPQGNRSLILAEGKTHGWNNAFHELNDIAIPLFQGAQQIGGDVHIAFYDVEDLSSEFQHASALTNSLPASIRMNVKYPAILDLNYIRNHGPLYFNKVVIIRNRPHLSFGGERILPFYRFGNEMFPEALAGAREFASRTQKHYCHSSGLGAPAASKKNSILVIYRDSSSSSSSSSSLLSWIFQFKNEPRREWINIHELKQHFHNKTIGNNFSIRFVDFANMTYPEIITSVCDASIIIGMHGAGLIHFMFARPGTVCVQVLTWKMVFPLELKKHMHHEFWGRLQFKDACNVAQGQYMDWPSKNSSWTRYPFRVSRNRTRVMELEDPSRPVMWYSEGPPNADYSLIDANLEQPVEDFAEMIQAAITKFEN